jgi:hypothetical protein
MVRTHTPKARAAEALSDQHWLYNAMVLFHAQVFAWGARMQRIKTSI